MRKAAQLFPIFLALFALALAIIFIVFTRLNLPPTRVISVVDGDTVDVLIDGKKEAVRLIGINAPELSPKECLADQAKTFAQNILSGQNVTLAPDPKYTDRDMFNRLLRYVSLSDGQDFGSLIISAGLARQYSFAGIDYKNHQTYEALQAQAKAQKLGLWGSECSQK